MLTAFYSRPASTRGVVLQTARMDAVVVPVQAYPRRGRIP